MDDILKWSNRIKNKKLPRWEELPELNLYLDQVLEYIHEILDPILIKHSDEESFLTPSMINNYVKHKYIPAPIKKRYDKNHLAFIISITVLKQVTNLNNISNGAKMLIKKLGKNEAYDVFVLHLENALGTVTEQNSSIAKKTFLNENVESHLLPLKTTTLAFAYKMLAEYLLTDIIKNTKENL